MRSNRGSTGGLSDAGGTERRIAVGRPRRHRLSRAALAAAVLGASVTAAVAGGLAATADPVGPAPAVPHLAVAQATTTTAPGQPTMAMSGSMAPGGTVTATGEGFEPGSTVTLSMDGNVMGTAAADTLGRVVFTFMIPADMAPGPKTMTMTGRSLTGTAVTLSSGVTIGALTGTLAPGAGPAAPLPAQPAMTG